MRSSLITILLFSVQLRAGPTSGEASQPDATAFVLDATKLPAPDKKFQFDLIEGITIAARSDMEPPTRLRALADWFERSGAAKMETDTVVQQSFLAFCDLRARDEIKAVMLVSFLQQVMSISPDHFAVSLTRYLDFPDQSVREAAMLMMDAEGVFALPATLDEHGFTSIRTALSNRGVSSNQLPAPFLEAMMQQDPVSAWADIRMLEANLHLADKSKYELDQRKYLDELDDIQRIVFELRNDRPPFAQPHSNAVQGMLLQASTSEHWYTRLLVAHLLKHHPRYVTKEIMDTLGRDSSKAVRDLAKLISGNPEKSGSSIWGE
jgi:hypothetical protein